MDIAITAFLLGNALPRKRELCCLRPGQGHRRGSIVTTFLSESFIYRNFHHDSQCSTSWVSGNQPLHQGVSKDKDILKIEEKWYPSISIRTPLPKHKWLGENFRDEIFSSATQRLFS